MNCSARRLAALLTSVLITAGVGGCAGVGEKTWSTQEKDGILQFAYGSDGDFPQVAALHLDSGYLRLVPTRESGWGTSVVLIPALWTGGAYHQGAKITATTLPDDPDLLVNYAGSIAGLSVRGQLRLMPPEDDAVRVNVAVMVTGNVSLDRNHPAEAFKPVLLSSMHVSETQWDAESAFASQDDVPLPGSGWILPAPVNAEVFGLIGGTSEWKTNAPTIEITLDETRPVTGWVTQSDDPNDDNVALWAAADRVLGEWEYGIVARE